MDRIAEMSNMIAMEGLLDKFRKPKTLEQIHSELEKLARDMQGDLRAIFKNYDFFKKDDGTIVHFFQGEEGFKRTCDGDYCTVEFRWELLFDDGYTSDDVDKILKDVEPKLDKVGAKYDKRAKAIYPKCWIDCLKDDFTAQFINFRDKWLDEDQ
jgi:hypothetical protein